MMLEEANERLKEKINEEQLWEITPLYILLDLHKDDFCRIVNAVGLENLLQKSDRYKRLERAEKELAAKERYLDAIARIEEIEYEKEQLEEIVNAYELT